MDLLVLLDAPVDRGLEAGREGGEDLGAEEFANIAVTALPLSESVGIQTDPPAVADCGVGDNDIGGTEEVAVQTEAVGALGS